LVSKVLLTKCSLNFIISSILSLMIDATACFCFACLSLSYNHPDTSFSSWPQSHLPLHHRPTNKDAKELT
jgi:hypothetical protein